MTGKKMTQYEALMEWRNLAIQERQRAEDALDWVVSLHSDLDRAEAENRYWRDSRWWYRLLWWKKGAS